MKKFRLLLAIVATSVMVYGQDIDQTMMDKDLEIAENILGTIIRQNMSDQFFYAGRGQEIDAKYLQNYGVVINVAVNHFRILTFDSRTGEEENDNLEETKGINKASGDEMVDALKDFLVDYGNMVRQLKPSDKILIKTESKNMQREIAMLAGQKKINLGKGMSAEIAKSDLLDYEKGNIDRQELLSKIQVNKNMNNAEREPQLEVFSSMLERLYEVDLSDTYYMASAPDYDRMVNFGVTYYLKFYSSTVHDDDNFSLPTIARKNVSKAERNKIVQEMYPTFLSGLKENILDYGYILKNLDREEMLVFHVKLTSCEGCDMPAVIEVSTKKSIIEDYRDNKLSLDKALAQIQVKNLGK